MFSPIYDIWFPTISCIHHVITMWCYIHVYRLYLDHIHKMSISSRVRVIVVEWPKLVVRPSAQNFFGVLATNYFRHSPVHVAVVTMCCHSCLHHMLIGSCLVPLVTDDYDAMLYSSCCGTMMLYILIFILFSSCPYRTKFMFYFQAESSIAGPEETRSSHPVDVRVHFSSVDERHLRSYILEFRP